MKPALKRIVKTGCLTDFTWVYAERRTSGNYLTLKCPLTASPDGKWCWRTEVRIETGSRGFSVQRETWETVAGKLHRKRGYRWYTCVDLRMVPLYEYKWEEVASTTLADGVVVVGTERSGRVRVSDSHVDATRVEWATFVDAKTTVVLPPDALPAIHTSTYEVLAGCAENRYFQPLVDWLTENVPCLTDLFMECGR